MYTPFNNQTSSNHLVYTHHPTTHYIYSIQTLTIYTPSNHSLYTQHSINHCIRTYQPLTVYTPSNNSMYHATTHYINTIQPFKIHTIHTPSNHLLYTYHLITQPTCFEMVHTVNMGLGIKATYPISFRKMAEQIHDVMEAVDYCTFERLQRFQYTSLYEYDDSNKI